MLSNLFLGVLTCSAVMSVLTVGYLIISKLLKKRQSARWRYAAWWLLGIGFLTPFKPALFGRAVYEFGSPYQTITYYDDGFGYSNSISVRNPMSVFGSASRAERMLIAFWLLGMLLAAVLMIRRQMRFQRSMKRLRRPADSVTQTVLELTCIDLGIPCNYKIYTLPVIVSPMMTGLFHPIILMPERKYDQEELRLILKHELLHHMHGDLWCKLLWMGCKVLHWFNPLIGLFMRRMEQDCELACDEAVMRGESPEAAGIYCDSILETALHQVRTGRHTPVLATNYSGSKEMLKDRMDSVLTRRRKRRYCMVFLLTALGVVFTGQIFSRRSDRRVFRDRYEPEVTEVTGIRETTYTPVTVLQDITYPDMQEMTTMLAVTTSTMAMQNYGITAKPETVPAVSAPPVMTTIFYGADGMIYAVSAYANQTIPPYVTSAITYTTATQIIP